MSIFYVYQLKSKKKNFKTKVSESYAQFAHTSFSFSNSMGSNEKKVIGDFEHHRRKVENGGSDAMASLRMGYLTLL